VDAKDGLHQVISLISQLGHVGQPPLADSSIGARVEPDNSEAAEAAEVIQQKDGQRRKVSKHSQFAPLEMDT